MRFMNTNHPNVTIKQVVDTLPSEFDQLRAEARSEGYHFLGRLAEDWASGVIRFDQPGEAFLGAYSTDMLAGVGGITIDPVIPEALRMRRFYIGPMCRRLGMGRTIAMMLLDRAQRSASLVTLNAAPNSFGFRESWALCTIFGPGTLTSGADGTSYPRHATRTAPAAMKAEPDQFIPDNLSPNGSPLCGGGSELTSGLTFSTFSIRQHILETGLAKTPVMLPNKFDTARILLRPVGPVDTEAIFSAYAQDEDVVRYLIWRPHRKVSETQAYIQHCLATPPEVERTYMVA